MRHIKRPATGAVVIVGNNRRNNNRIIGLCSNRLIFESEFKSKLGPTQPRPSPSPPPPPSVPPEGPQPEPQPVPALVSSPQVQEPDGPIQSEVLAPEAETKLVIQDPEDNSGALRDLLDSLLPAGDSQRSLVLVADDGSNSSGLSGYVSARSEAVGDTDSEYSSLVSAEEDEVTLVPEDSVLVSLQTPVQSKARALVEETDYVVSERVDDTETTVGPLADESLALGFEEESDIPVGTVEVEAEVEVPCCETGKELEKGDLGETCLEVVGGEEGKEPCILSNFRVEETCLQDSCVTEPVTDSQIQQEVTEVRREPKDLEEESVPLEEAFPGPYGHGRFAAKDDAAEARQVLDLNESFDETVTPGLDEFQGDPHDSVTVEACRIALELLDLSQRDTVDGSTEEEEEEGPMPCARRGEEEGAMADVENNVQVVAEALCADSLDENVNLNASRSGTEVGEDPCDNETRAGPEQQNSDRVENGLSRVQEEELQSSSPCPTLDEARNQSEAGPDVAQIKEDEFRSAVEFFTDPSAFEFLQKAGGKAFTESALSRMSLYVKFDPLMKPPTPVPPKSESLAATCAEEGSRSELVPSAEVQRLIDFGTSPCKPKQSPDSDSVPDSKATVFEGLVDLRQELVTRELYFQEQLLKKDREWNDRMKQMDKENQQLIAQVQRLRETQQQMRQIVVEYEVTISQLIAEKEKDKQSMVEMKTQLTKERDQALEDMQGVEVAFGDLHRRYEKSKAAVDAFKKNEETLKHCVAEYQLKLKKQEQKYELLKSHAEEKLQSANAEVDLIKKGADAEIAAQRAQLKKAEMKIDSLERNLEQKVKENAELTNICDELIAKVGLSK